VKKIEEYDQIIINASVDLLSVIHKKYIEYASKGFGRVEPTNFFNHPFDFLNSNYISQDLKRRSALSMVNIHKEIDDIFDEILSKYSFLRKIIDLPINIAGAYGCSMVLTRQNIIQHFSDIISRNQEFSLPLILETFESLYESTKNEKISVHRSIIVFGTFEGFDFKGKKYLCHDEISINDLSDIYKYNDNLFNLFLKERELNELFDIELVDLKRIEIIEMKSFTELKNESNNNFSSIDHNKIFTYQKKLNNFYLASIIYGAKIKFVNHLVHFDPKFLSFTFFKRNITDLGTFKKTRTQKKSIIDIGLVEKLYHDLNKCDDIVIQKMNPGLNRFQNYYLSKDYSDKCIELRITIDALMDINLKGGGYMNYANFRIRHLLPEYSSRYINKIYRELSSSVHSNDISKISDDKEILILEIEELIRKLIIVMVKNNKFMSHDEWLEIHKNR